MARLILLLSGILTFIDVTVYSSDENALKSLTNIIPKHYNIKFSLYVEQNTFMGECDIIIKILETTHTISMFAEKMSMMRSRLIVLSDQNTIDIYNELGHSYDYDRNIFHIYFNEELSPGDYILNVRYTSSMFNNGGFQRIFYYSEEGLIWLSATLFQRMWDRRMFPRWSSSKTTFDISIYHSENYKVLSNMPIQATSIPMIRIDQDLGDDNMQWTYFNSTPAMSPFLVSIVVTNFVQNFIHEDDIASIWCDKRSISSLQFALAITKNITIYLKKEWKRLQQFPKVNYIVIPEFQERNDNMVNLGIILYNEADVTYNEKTDSIGCKYNVMHVIGYEIIREWFESIVNPFWWPNSWLSKGFTTFLTIHTLNQSLPNSRIIDLFVVQFQHESLHFDVDNRMLPYQGKPVSTKIVNYVKASVILRVLQHGFNIDAFWLGIRTYLYEKKHHSDNFWEALKNAYDKINPRSYDIKEMMYPWTTQKGYPVLNILHHNADSIKVSIKNLNGPNENRWIPISYTTETDSNFNIPAPLFWLKPPKKPFNRPYSHYFILPLKHREDGWIIFNIQQIGYYRIKYDNRYWQKIALYLNSENYWKIHVLNRAQIIDDAFHFMLLRKLKTPMFWELAKYLSQEIDYIAWYPMFKAMQYISNSFTYLEMGEYPTKEQLRQMLNGVLEIIEYEEKPTDNDFTKALRQEAAQWACFLKLYDCLKMANNLLKQHLEISTKLSPLWKKWTYCYGLQTADNTTWHQMLNKIRGNNREISYFLTCPNHLVEINNYTLTSYTKIDFELNYKPPQYNMDNDQSFMFLISTKSIKSFRNLLQDFKNITPR
ncbi:aminopeptidase N-like [Polyergus mexicanus]|uniref:aminopeptidase N-like n=1 Tax=Polyergus mexicanus TaxID=615972 RepID=UPI0038B44480